MTGKTIWILNHYAHAPDMPGGTRHYDFAAEFVRRGYRVTIFAASYSHEAKKETKLAAREKYKEETINGVRFVWIRTFPYRENDWRRILGWLEYMIRTVRFGAASKERPDVIIGSSVHLFAPLAAYILSKIKRARFFFEVRDLWPRTLIEVGAYSPVHPAIIFFRFLERFLYKRADRIISLLPRGDDYISSLGVPRNKVVWIPNGVDLSLFGRQPVLKEGSDNFTVMYLGALGGANDAGVVINAAKIIQDKAINTVYFTIIGEGPEKNGLIGLARKLSLRNLEFRDQIPKSLVPEILAEADAFVFGMKNRSIYRFGISPNKLFDYFSAGRPVICHGHSADNPIDMARAGMSVPPEDPEALAGAVIEMSALSPEERTAMGERGRSYLIENHDIKKLADRFIRLFEE